MLFKLTIIIIVNNEVKDIITALLHKSRARIRVREYLKPYLINNNNVLCILRKKYLEQKNFT